MRNQSIGLKNQTMRANVRRALPDFDLEDSENEYQDEFLRMSDGT